jgi:hypothetical protein
MIQNKDFRKSCSLTVMSRTNYIMNKSNIKDNRKRFYLHKTAITRGDVNQYS